jgi:hypothetical protein
MNVTARQPISARPMLGNGSGPAQWPSVHQHVGQSSATFWLATVHADRTPHVRPILAVWVRFPRTRGNGDFPLLLPEWRFVERPGTARQIRTRRCSSDSGDQGYLRDFSKHRAVSSPTHLPNGGIGTNPAAV